MDKQILFNYDSLRFMAALDARSKVPEDKKEAYVTRLAAELVRRIPMKLSQSNTFCRQTFKLCLRKAIFSS